MYTGYGRLQYNGSWSTFDSNEFCVLLISSVFQSSLQIWNFFDEVLNDQSTIAVEIRALRACDHQWNIADFKTSSTYSQYIIAKKNIAITLVTFSDIREYLRCHSLSISHELWSYKDTITGHYTPFLKIFSYL